MEGNDIGYIRISTFNERTSPMLQDALRNLRRDGGANLRGVVIDLRNNPAAC